MIWIILPICLVWWPGVILWILFKTTRQERENQRISRAFQESGYDGPWSE